MDWRQDINSFLFWIKIYLLSLLLCPLFDRRAMALNETFDVYSAPQAFAMGNAMTAEATGYLSHYYNPAGLAKARKRKGAEVHIVGIDGILSGQAIATVASSKTLGLYRLFGPMREAPGQYHYFRFNNNSSVSWRGFGLSLLWTYEYAAQSDGTHIDIFAHQDIGPVVGGAMNLAGNLIKIGVSGKAIVRNELNGVFAHTALDGGDEVISSHMKEGLGIGANLGVHFTYPSKYLPSIGLTLKDIGNTSFRPTKLLNGYSAGIPFPIKQSANVGVSVKGYLTRRLRSTYAADIHDVDKPNIPFRKRLHFGVQLEDEKSLYFWAGLNQLFITGGMGLRLPGGNWEVGTFSQDIGAGESTQQDRRYFFRYTVSF